MRERSLNIGTMSGAGRYGVADRITCASTV